MSSAALVRARRRIQELRNEAAYNDRRLADAYTDALEIIDEESERAAEREFTRPLNGPEPVGEKR